jgi:hypothetical protein
MTAELIYVGEPGKFYAKITVGGNYQRTLEPVPGEHYLIDDPDDGNWKAVEAEKVVLAATEPVTPDVKKSAQNAPTAPVDEA